MSDVKRVADKLFNAEDYKNLTIKLSINNLTAKTQVTDARVIRKQINSSLVLGSTKALELLECSDDYVIVGSTIQIGALGHDVEIKVAVFTDEEETEKLLAFKSRCKITMFEKRQVDDREVYFIHYTFQKGDYKFWKQLTDILHSKQKDINEMFKTFKGS